MKEKYEEPKIRVIEVVVEKGFAISNDGGGVIDPSQPMPESIRFNYFRYNYETKH